MGSLAQNSSSAIRPMLQHVATPTFRCRWLLRFSFCTTLYALRAQQQHRHLNGTLPWKPTGLHIMVVSERTGMRVPTPKEWGDRDDKFGLRALADSLPWFDSPLVQGASRLRYTDKAQMQRPGHTGRKALATKKREIFFSCGCLLASMARSVNCHGRKSAVQVHLIGAKPIVQVKRGNER